MSHNLVWRVSYRDDFFKCNNIIKIFLKSLFKKGEKINKKNIKLKKNSCNKKTKERGLDMYFWREQQKSFGFEHRRLGG